MYPSLIWVWKLLIWYHSCISPRSQRVKPFFPFQKSAAREKYEISIQEIEHNEKQAQQRADEVAAKTEELALHQVYLREMLTLWYDELSLETGMLWRIPSDL